MAKNQTWLDRVDATLATGALSEWPHAIANAIKAWLNSPWQDLGAWSSTVTFESQGGYTARSLSGDETWDFSGIINGNMRYQKITTDGSHTITVGTNGRVTNGSLGQLAAGTYDVYMASIGGEVQISVPGTGVQDQLEQVTGFSANAGSEQVSLSWNAVLNADGYVLQFSLDQLAWTNVPSYGGTATNHTHTGLSNGTPYFYRLSATATGYTQSAYVTDSATPGSGSQQLPQITGVAISTNNKYSELTLTWNAPSGNADNLSVERSLDGSTGWAEVGTPTTNAISFTDTTVASGIEYFYRIREIGDGISFTNGNYSLVVSDTTLSGLADNFAGTVINTDKWLITNPSSEVVITQNDALIFTEDATAIIGAGTDHLSSKLTLQRQVMTMQTTISRARDHNMLCTPFIEILDESLTHDDRIVIIPGGGTNSKQYGRILINVGGAGQYDFTSAIDFDNTWKIEMDADGTVRVYYLSAPDTWTQVGVTQSTIMTNLNYVAFMSSNSTTSDINGDAVEFDTAYFVPQHYATSIPS